jgi:hypothetical protein
VAHAAVGEHRSPTAPAPPPLEEVLPPEEEEPPPEEEEPPPEDPPSTELVPDEPPEHAGIARPKAGSRRNASVVDLDGISIARSYAYRSRTRCHPNG